MKKSFGITENEWNKLEEEERFYWRGFSRLLAFIAALFVTKTGNFYFDWTLTLLTTILMFIAIEIQRPYSRLKPPFRKKYIRIVIFLGASSIAVLGILLFAQAGVSATIITFSNSIAPQIIKSTSTFTSVLIICAFLFALPTAVLRVFRQTGVEEMIYHHPKRGLIQLFVYKKFKATSFRMLAIFELSVLLVCLLYASSVARVASTLMTLG